MLGDHIRRCEHRAGKHKFPVQGDAFRLQRHHIEVFRVVNKRQFALRCESGDQLRIVLVGIGQAGDMGHRFNANPRQLVGERFAVIDNMMRARFATYFWLSDARRYTIDTCRVSLLASWVSIEPTPPAAPTISSVSPALPPSLYAKAVEQQLPGGYGGER